MADTTGINRQTAEPPQWGGGVCSASVALVLVWLLIGVGGVSGVVVADGTNGTINPVVADATGEQVVVVEIESDWTAESTPTTVEQLEQRVTRSQAPLRQYAKQTPGVIVERSFWLGNLAVVTIDHGRTDVTDLAGIRNVVHVGPNFEVSANRAGGEVDTTGAVRSLPGQTPSGPPVTGRDRGPTATDTTYGLDQINATEVWSAYGTRGEGVSVAVLDTGVDADHPDLSVEKWQEFDSNGNPVDSQPNDGDGHGTHVSGTVTGAENPAGPVPSFGVAPEAALYGVKVLDDSGGGSFAQVIAGMQWAVDNDADIISMSLGAPGFYDQMIDPVRNAQDAGTVVIASAGNSGEGSSGSPGNVYDAVSVGMSNESRGIDSDSSGEVIDTASDWGSSAPAYWPDEYTVPTIAAPGVDVLSSVPGGGYGLLTGTSMAAPHVSGAVALAESATNDSLSPEAIEEALEATAFKPDSAPAPPGERDTRYGSGIIDANALVNYLQAEFAVSVVSANAPVVGGEQLNVTAGVNNTGNMEATKKIDLSVGDLGSSSTSVTLGGGNSTNVTLSVGTGAGDAGAYTATVSSPDDAASTNVTVLAPAAFTVDIAETNTPVEGELLNVTAEVENTGDAGDTQTIDLSVGTLGTDSTTVTLGGGSSTNVTLSVGTGAGDAGAYTVTVASEDDTASANVTVNEPAAFDVTITSVDATVTAGETVTVVYEVTNTGDVQDTQDITFAVNGTTEDTETGVTLNGSETFSGQFSYTTGSSDTPAVTIAVASEDDAASETVTVNAPATFDVTIISVDSAVTAGEIVTASYEVTNTGDVQATQDINFSINGSVEDTEQSVTLNESETFSGQFSYTTGSTDTPAVSVAVASEDDSASETVTVNAPAAFNVAITSVDSAVTAGEFITASYELTNTGDVQATQDIEFSINGTVNDTEAGVTLNGSETFSGQFTYTTGAVDTPAVSVAVASEDDSASETVTVNDPAVFDVTITSVDSAVTAGEIITASYEVTNTGDVQATQDIEFMMNGTTEDTESGVTLNGSETFSGQFSYRTESADTPAVTVTVVSEDDSAIETVTVNDPAAFDVTLTSVHSVVTAGELITASYEVMNTGDVQATQDIEFTVNGTTEDSESGVTLNGSETVSGQFTYTTGSVDTPAVSVAVSSADDLETETVTVNEPASFDVTITSVDSAVTEGETITVSYELQNTGDVTDTQEITFAVNGTAEDTASGVTLDGSETFSGQFSYDTVAGDTPAVSVTVSSADDSASATVTVNEPANFDVTLTSVDSAVTEGETVAVAYEVTNTGDVADTQDIGFAVNGTTEDTASSVTLNGSETVSGQFSYATSAGDASAVTVAVLSADDSATQTVTVNEPASFDVTITSVDSAVTAGETITVAYEVTNIGDVADTQDIGFAVRDNRGHRDGCDAERERNVQRSVHVPDCCGRRAGGDRHGVE